MSKIPRFTKKPAKSSLQTSKSNSSKPKPTLKINNQKKLKDLTISTEEKNSYFESKSIQDHIQKSIDEKFETEEESKPQNIEIANQIANILKKTTVEDEDELEPFDDDLKDIIFDEIHAKKEESIPLHDEIENELLFEYEPSEDSLLYAQLNKPNFNQKVEAINNSALAFTLLHIDLVDDLAHRKRSLINIALGLPSEKGRRTFMMKKATLLKKKTDLNIERRFPLDMKVDLEDWFNGTLEISVDVTNEWCGKGAISLSKFKKKSEFRKKVPLWSVRKYGKQENFYIGDLFINSQLLNYESSSSSEEELPVKQILSDTESELFQSKLSKTDFTKNTDSLLNDIPLIKPQHIPGEMQVEILGDKVLNILISQYHPLSSLESDVFCCIKILPLGQPIQTVPKSSPYVIDFEVSIPFIPDKPGIIEIWRKGSPNVFIGLCKLSFDKRQASGGIMLLFPSASLSVSNPITGEYQGALEVCFGFGNEQKLKASISKLNKQSLHNIFENDFADEFVDATNVNVNQQTNTSLSNLNKTFNFLKSKGVDQSCMISPETKSGYHQTNTFRAKDSADQTQSKKNVEDKIVGDSKNPKDEYNQTIGQILENKNFQTSNRNIAQDNKTKTGLIAKSSAIPAVTDNGTSFHRYDGKHIPLEEVNLDEENVIKLGSMKLQISKIFPLHNFEDRLIEDFESQNSNRTRISESSFYVTFNWYPDAKGDVKSRQKKIVHAASYENNCITFNKIENLAVQLSPEVLSKFKSRKQTLKLWRKSSRGDFLIAFTILDLHYLFDGLDTMEQWFDLVDSNGVVLGQILVNLEVDKSIFRKSVSMTNYCSHEQVNLKPSASQFSLRSHEDITQHDLESIYSIADGNMDKIHQYLNRINK
eukprot:NODE_26_length_40862_cov_0.679513.p4 type:complete len:876 gc:universal NODE_26_length_40862_cov_0.679513:3103-5730(+)